MLAFAKPLSSTQMLISDFDSDLNSVIMDYLISEGYPIAAQKFALEANIQPKVDFDSIRERVEIRNAIYGGDIQSAVEKINELNPQVSLGFLILMPCARGTIHPVPRICYEEIVHAPLIYPIGC